MNTDQGFVDSDGLRIRYAVTGSGSGSGSGSAMVLVHGWGSDSQGNWGQTGWIDTLSGVRRVVTLDVRGHGGSDKPLDSARYSYAAMAQDVLAVLNHLGIEKADFLGYSMGAFIGVWLLGHHSNRFRSMVLGGVGSETAASIAVVGRIAAALRAEDAATIKDPLGAAYRRFLDANPAIDARARAALAVSALQMWPEGDAIALGGPKLATVDIPVLCVVGGNDTPYVQTVPQLVAAVPGTRLLTIPGHDHLSVVPTPAFKAAVLALLGEVDLPG